MVRSWPDKESVRRGGHFKRNKGTNVERSGGGKGHGGLRDKDWFHVVVKAQAYYRENN